ncbi:MAG TPA: hypothetical protein VGM83_06435 [Devosiaceae bacterium]|jgi:hypothetical protein
MLGGYIGDLEAGDVLRPVTYVLTQEHCSEHAHGAEQNAEIFHSSDNPLGRQIRMPTMVHTDKMRLLELNCPLEPRFSGKQAKDARIHYEYHATHHGVAYVGDTINVTARIADRYEKRGREYLDYEIEVRTGDGRLITTYKDKTLLKFIKAGA